MGVIRSTLFSCKQERGLTFDTYVILIPGKKKGKYIMKKWYDEEYEFTVEVVGFLHGDTTEHYCRNGEEIGDVYKCTYGCPVNKDGYGICSKIMMMLYPIMEAVRSGGDLENIINYISELDNLNTEGVEPTYQVFEMENIWRNDEIKEQEATREDLLALTKESQDNQIKVPKVL